MQLAVVEELVVMGVMDQLQVTQLTQALNTKEELVEQDQVRGQVIVQ
jgi:hypothetical protein